MLPGMRVDEPDMRVTNTGEGHVESPSGSSQALKKAESTEEQTKETVENLACTEGFKYISTMSSFEDPYFKDTVRMELLKDRKVTWTAFSELSPASV